MRWKLRPVIDLRYGARSDPRPASSALKEAGKLFRSPLSGLQPSRRRNAGGVRRAVVRSVRQVVRAAANRAARLLLAPLFPCRPAKASKVRFAGFDRPAYGARPEWLRVGTDRTHCFSASWRQFRNDLRSAEAQLWSCALSMDIVSMSGSVSGAMSFVQVSACRFSVCR